MGLSSSQARLLNLTARMHQLEYKAARLESMKLQMANDSRRVYDEYLFALDKSKVQFKTLREDGSIDYIDATYNTMIDNGYQIKFKGDERVIISTDVENNWIAAAGNREYFIALQTGRVTTDNQTVGGVIEVYTADQLLNMSSGKNYRLMSNIDLTGKNWTSKTLNSGKTFDGNGYTITGLNNTMFSSVAGGTIKNLILDNVSISSSASNVGALVASTSGTSTIENVSLSGSLVSTSNSKVNVGSLVGYNTGTLSINGISSSVNISKTGTGEGKVGGIVGMLKCGNTTITNSKFDGNITTIGSNVLTGGVLGVAQLENATNTLLIQNTTSSGTISSNISGSADSSGTGGIAGSLWTVNTNNIVVDGCQSNMNINSEVHAGGIAGFLEGNITNSYATGVITATGAYAGGIAGKHNGGLIDNCYSNTTLSSNLATGTVAGATTDAGRAPAYISNSSGVGATNEVGAGVHTNDTNAANLTTIQSANTTSGASHTHTTVLQDDNNDGVLFDEISKYGYILEGTQENPATGNEDSVEWFSNMINEGVLYLYKFDDKQEQFYQVSVSVETDLREVNDESVIRKAEAKYEADMKKIDMKDRKYDTDLAALDTERNAINQEIETLKSVAKENVERTFRLFG